MIKEESNGVAFSQILYPLPVRERERENQCSGSQVEIMRAIKKGRAS